MSLSPAARRWAEARGREVLAARKAAVRAALDRVQHAVDPPLSNAEMAIGLDLPETEIGRIRSASDRLRAYLPEASTQAALDALIEGTLLLALYDDPRQRRRVVQVCTDEEAARLGREWALHNIAGGPLPERQSSWDEEDAWDLFDDGPAPIELATPGPERGPSRPDVRLGPADDRLLISPMGLGAMRLSTADRPPEAQARDTLNAAIDAGLRFIDTADVYARDADDLHHNERLIAAVLAERADREAVVVGTKVGLARAGTRWLPAGDPAHLRAAVERSRAALGVERLDWVQLHAIDRRVPIEESVGALAAMRAEGLIRHIGLCNVDLEQLRAARAIAPIVSVQNAWSLLDKVAWEKGVIEHCRAYGIVPIAHSPLGGHKRAARLAKDPVLMAIGEAHGVGPHAVALAHLMDAGLVPIPGCSRPETARASAAALHLRLTDADRARLDERYPRIAAADRPPVFTAGSGPEAVVIMGPPAAGKSSRVQPLLDQGYVRLNRDEIGGKLDDLVRHLERAHGDGHRRFVLDNTYPNRKSRAKLLASADKLNLPVRCIWLDADKEAVQFNAARRLMQKYGRMLEPDELVAAGQEDPNTFPPVVLSSWFRKFEPPTTDEGFASILRVPYRRVLGPEYVNRALICDYDGTLRETRSGETFPRSADDVVALPGRSEVLRAYRDAGWRLLGVSNQGGVAAGMLSFEAALSGIMTTHRQLGIALDARFCSHPVRPLRCYCRKPMPGFAVEFIERFKLDPARCIMVGDMRSDRRFADAAGFQYYDADAFFTEPPPP